MSLSSSARKSNASAKSNFASSSSSTFSSPGVDYFLNSATTSSRSNTSFSNGASPSVRFGFGFGFESASSTSRSISPVARDHVVTKEKSKASSSRRRTCMCSPTTHPGSFRCSLHKNTNANQAARSSNNRLNARRSAMTNSLVRIGSVEGDLVKRALAALIRPSSHQQRRRSAFQIKPSRLSLMSKADVARADFVPM